MTFSSYQFNQQTFSAAKKTYLLNNQTVTAEQNIIQIPNRFTEATGDNYAHLYFSFPALAADTTFTIIGETDYQSIVTETVSASAGATNAQSEKGYLRVSSIIPSTTIPNTNIGYLKQYALYSRDGTVTSIGVSLPTVPGATTTWTLEAGLYQQSRITSPYPPDRIFYGLGASFTSQTASTANLLLLENPVGKLKMIVEATDDASEPKVVWQFGARRII